MRVHSIFQSINGECTRFHQGSICTFIRLAGCNLRCGYCDTTHAQEDDSGKEMNLDRIVLQVRELQNVNVTITGGEPLYQKAELKELVQELHYRENLISIETNGSYRIPSGLGWPVDCWVVDWKGPSSGMRNKMSVANFKDLCGRDFVKFVIKDYGDFNDAMHAVIRILKQSINHPNFAFSPMWNQIDHAVLAKWMLGEPRLKECGAIFNLQIHKIIAVE